MVLLLVCVHSPCAGAFSAGAPGDAPRWQAMCMDTHAGPFRHSFEHVHGLNETHHASLPSH